MIDKEEILKAFKGLSLKWKAIIACLIVALVAGIISMVPASTTKEKESTTPETDKIEATEDEKEKNEEDHHLDIEEMDKLIEENGYKLGYTESVDDAKQWLVDNQEKLSDQYHLSAEYLYLEMISPTNGGAFTQTAAAEAVKTCEYNFKENALYWANYYAAIGVTNTDAIKKELMHDHRFGGGFTEGEASYAVANMTAEKGDKIYDNAFGVEYSSDSKSYKTDVDKCAEIVKTLVKKNSTSKLETEYQVVMNYGYSPSTYAVALEEVGPNWVYVAKDVATRYKSEEMTDLRKVMMTLLERFGGFSEGEAIYGSSVITTSK